MQIFGCQFDLPEGKVSHNVFADWDDKTNLHFVEQIEGEGLKGPDGPEGYESYFMIHSEDVAKFVLYALWKGFTYENRLDVEQLKNMCNELEISYETEGGLMN
jgi:hypothetical protein